MRSFELRLSQGFSRLSLMLCLAFAASPLYAADPAPAAPSAPAAATAAPKAEARDFPETGVRVYDLDQTSVAPTTVPEPKSDLRKVAVDSRSHTAAPLRESQPLPKMGGKFWRGIVNVATGWVEIPKTLIVDSIEVDPFTGILCGLTIGTAKGVERTVVGALEVVTFWHEWPKEYAPIIQPEYVLDDVAN